MKKPSVPRAPWRLKKEEREKEKAANSASTEPPKPRKKNKLLATMPDNWEEEERKFFESDGSYNPQFEYTHPSINKKFIKMFPEPKDEYMPIAVKILNKFLETYGSESNYLETEGRTITEKEEVEQIINNYLDEHGQELKSVSKINFSTKNVASTSVTYDNISSKIKINV